MQPTLPGSLKDTFALTLPTETTIQLLREFPADAALVYQALTRPEHVRRWWNPCGTDLEICEIDLRVGGRWRYVFQVEGQRTAFNGVFQTLEAPSFLKTTQVFESEELGNPESVVETRFEALAQNLTRLTCTMYYPNKESRDGHLHSGMEWGSSAAYDNLEVLLLQR